VVANSRFLILPGVRFAEVVLQSPKNSTLPPVPLWAEHLHEQPQSITQR